MNLRTAQYDKDPAVLSFWQQTLDRVRALPGVECAAVGTAIPLTDDHSRTDITVEGMACRSRAVIRIRTCTSSVRVMRRRWASACCGAGASRMRIRRTFREWPWSMRTVAQRLFPGTDPMGKRFSFGAPRGRPGAEVGHDCGGGGGHQDVWPRQSRAARGLRAVPPDGVEWHGAVGEIGGRTSGAGLRRFAGLSASIDKEQPIFRIATMQEVVDASVSTRRITLILLGLFSGLALVLAGIGIYGVISYSVAQRRQRDRDPDGAGRAARRCAAAGDRRRAARLVGGGHRDRGAASLALTRLMANLLYSVSAADPATFGVVSAAFAVVAAAASYVPARRALRSDPVRTLRCE